MKGLFIPDITAEMFRNGCLEGIEALMAEGEIYDIDYTGWIPCSERLPEDGQGVLVTVDTNKWNIEVGSCIYSGGTFHSKLYDLDVLAWMPLPKPYREDGEE